MCLISITHHGLVFKDGLPAIEPILVGVVLGLVSKDGQDTIAAYKINGEQLFFPNAK